MAAPAGGGRPRIDSGRRGKVFWPQIAGPFKGRGGGKP